MKQLFSSIIFSLAISFGFGQIVKLSDEESVKDYLNKKEFMVGNYGSILFEYDSYNKDFGTIVFLVEYNIPNDKNHGKYEFKAEIIINNNDFISPNFVRGFSLRNDNSIYSMSYDFPIMFELYENGELYYQEKINIELANYLNARKLGESSIKMAQYKLCQAE